MHSTVETAGYADNAMDDSLIKKKKINISAYLLNLQNL
jgi:hypothetical protein